MQHHDLSRRARLGSAAVVERLHAGVRDADRVGIMAVRLEAPAPEPRAEQLDTVGNLCAGDPVRSLTIARSFKTFVDSAATLVDHVPGRSGFMTPERALAFLAFSVVAAG